MSDEAENPPKDGATGGGGNHGNRENADLGVRRKLKTFCRRRRKTNKEMKQRKWSFKFGSTKSVTVETVATETEVAASCTVYRRCDDEWETTPSNEQDCQEGYHGYHRCDRQPVTDEPVEETVAEENEEETTVAKENSVAVETDDEEEKFEDYPMEDWDERARLQRAKEMEEGVEPPPGYKPKVVGANKGGGGAIAAVGGANEMCISELAHYLQNHLMLKSDQSEQRGGADDVIVNVSPDTVQLSKNVLAVLKELTLATLFQTSVHTQVDYIHCLVPDLLDITNCSCYWGKMDRYEAERLLENKPEGTFLLRDSAQEEFLFSVSFQRYGKTLHARIEQWNHKFSFDSHDPGVFSSHTVCGLIEHYKDPTCCMYFDPMLTIPLPRSFAFTLQHLCRAHICDSVTYDSINALPLPKQLRSNLKEYHYKQRVKVRRFDY